MSLGPLFVSETGQLHCPVGIWAGKTVPNAGSGRIEGETTFAAHAKDRQGRRVRAVSATRSAVKPNFSKLVGPGAEAPKRSRPTAMPAVPM